MHNGDAPRSAVHRIGARFWDNARQPTARSENRVEYSTALHPIHVKLTIEQTSNSAPLYVCPTHRCSMVLCLWWQESGRGRAATTRARHSHAHLTSCTQLSDRSSARGTIFQPSQQYEGIFSCSRRSRPSHLMSPFSVRIACSTHPAPSVRGHRTHKVTPGSPRGTSQRLLPPAPTPSPQPEPLPPLRFPSPRPVEHAAVSPPRWRRP